MHGAQIISTNERPNKESEKSLLFRPLQQSSPELSSLTTIEFVDAFAKCHQQPLTTPLPT